MGEGVEVQGVVGVEGGAGGGGVSAEGGLGEGYAEGGVGGEVEGWVAFAPVSVVGVSWWEREMVWEWGVWRWD